MHNSKSAQTATEYLVLVAVVIIIAVLVVNILGGIPSILSGPNEQTFRAILGTQTISITDYSVTDYDTVFTIRNNHNSFVEIDTITINGERCHFFSNQNVKLQSGKSTQIQCTDVFELDDSKISWPIIINWTDTQTGASYSQDSDDLVLIGQVGSKYMTTLQANEYWNDSISGCYDTSSEPHPICTCVDLNKTRLNLDKNHTLQNSIDFERCKDTFGADFTSAGGSGWLPLGDASTQFTGYFDGQRHIINSLFISRPGSNYTGLFGVAIGSSISNLGLTNVDITGKDAVGGILGSDGLFIPYVSYYNGQSSFDNSYVSGVITGSATVGGLVGAADQTTIAHSHSIVSVNSSSNHVGGLVGSLSGSFGNQAIITDSYSSGSVTGTANVGGLVGYSTYGTITNSYTESKVYGSSNVGGLVSNNYYLILSGDVYWTNYSDDNATSCISGSNPAGCDVVQGE